MGAFETILAVTSSLAFAQVPPDDGRKEPTAEFDPDSMGHGAPEPDWCIDATSFDGVPLEDFGPGVHPRTPLQQPGLFGMVAQLFVSLLPSGKKNSGGSGGNGNTSGPAGGNTPPPPSGPTQFTPSTTPLPFLVGSGTTSALGIEPVSIPAGSVPVDAMTLEQLGVVEAEEIFRGGIELQPFRMGLERPGMRVFSPAESIANR
ncbi:MAG: hypothetical protein Q7S00_03565 [bacterium]|nr:hypothetical protein [bacterium]